MLNTEKPLGNPQKTTISSSSNNSSNNAVNSNISKAVANPVKFGLLSNAISYVGNNIFNAISSLTSPKVNVKEDSQIIRNNIYYTKQKLTPEDFSIESIKFNPNQATIKSKQDFISNHKFDIPFYDNACFNNHNQQPRLNARSFISFLQENFQLDDMLIHHDPLLILATMQKLKVDIINTPIVDEKDKQNVEDNFAYLKQQLLDRIDNPRQTTLFRQGFKDTHPDEVKEIHFSTEQIKAIKEMSI